MGRELRLIFNSIRCHSVSGVSAMADECDSEAELESACGDGMRHSVS